MKLGIATATRSPYLSRPAHIYQGYLAAIAHCRHQSWIRTTVCRATKRYNGTVCRLAHPQSAEQRIESHSGRNNLRSRVNRSNRPKPKNKSSRKEMKTPGPSPFGASNRVITRKKEKRGGGEKEKDLGLEFLRTEALELRTKLPLAPLALFEGNINVLHDILSIDTRTETRLKSGLFTCRTQVIGLVPGLKNPSFTATHKSKKLAEKLAYFRLIKAAYECGALAFLESPVHNDMDTDAKGSSGRIDIYDYCAMHNLIPDFALKAYSIGGKRSIFQATLELSAQNIRVISRARSPEAAESQACAEFKKQAESWHSENSGASLVVKDALSLNSRNAKKFFDFCKIKDPHMKLTCVVNNWRLPNVRQNIIWFSSQVSVNGEPIGEPVIMRHKKAIETAAWTTAAIVLRRKYPKLFEEFLEALKRGQGEVLRPLRPLQLRLDGRCMSFITNVLNQGKDIASANRFGTDSASVRNIVQQGSLRETGPSDMTKYKLNERQLEWKSRELLAIYESYYKQQSFAELRQKRSELPVCQYKDPILEMINSHRVSIIIGSTGSGKTTQIPQLLLEQAIREGRGAECNIICTQPRRIAAKSVAERVAFERNEKLQESVGYHVRFDPKLPRPGGSILYCTTGILLQQLRGQAESTLEGVTHIVIDEVHERDLMIDFLLVILKRLLLDIESASKTPFKIVLMSATANSELFSTYFSTASSDGTLVPCPSITVPGRLHPVKNFYLDHLLKEIRDSHDPRDIERLYDHESIEYLNMEKQFQTRAEIVPMDAISQTDDILTNPEGSSIDWKGRNTIQQDGSIVSGAEEDACVPIGLIATVIAHIVKTTTEGAILVFLPGLQEIQAVHEKLIRFSPLGVNFHNDDRYSIQMLHSSLTHQQMDVFRELETGRRRIILSTNIAETSVTIPDVRYVVDSGKLREKQYEQSRRLTRLLCTWISKSNAKQRAGRAGRVRDGYYFALFSKLRFESFRSMGLPEMLRSDLQEICLDVKSRDLSGSVANFLAEAIEPPNPVAVESALRDLTILGAIDPEGNLSPLGMVLATMPVEPALGKMILLGAIFRCLDPMIVLGAASTTRELFVNPLGKQKNAWQKRAWFARGTNSDHVATINAFRAWREIRESEGANAAFEFANAMFLHPGALHVIDQTANQIEQILVNCRIIPFLDKNERFNNEFGHPKLNNNSSSVPLMKALILAGFYPNIAASAGGRRLRTVNEDFTIFHPGSVNYSLYEKERLLPYGSLFSYSGKQRSNYGNQVLLRHTTKVTLLSVILFGGTQSQANHLLLYDDWLPFLYMNPRILMIAKNFKKIVDEVLNDMLKEILSRNHFQNILNDNGSFAVVRNGVVKALEAEVSRSPEQKYTNLL